MVILLIVVVAGILIYESYVNGTGLSSIPVIGPIVTAVNMYSYSQLVTFAQNAGFSGNDALTAAAVAMAESGGNARAYNKEPQDVPGRYNRLSSDDGKGSYSLWQIYLAAHPEFTGQDLYDPQTNANAAYSVWLAAQGSFSPWSTFNNGNYAQYLPCCTGGASNA